MIITTSSIKATKKQAYQSKDFKDNNIQSQKQLNNKLSVPSSDLLKSYYLPKKNSINFSGVKITKIGEGFEKYTDVLQQELNKFDEVGKNAKRLGEGAWAQTYSFKKLPFIIKTLLKNENELPKEAQTLMKESGKDFLDFEIDGMKKASKALTNTQKFVAKAISDDGVKYLVSTMVKGKHPNPEEMPWTRKNFKSLFKTMFNLDKEGIYQGDINGGNIKISENDANFIDYQWTTKIEPKEFFEENKVQEFPANRFIENDQMFQMAGLSNYLKKVDKDEAKGVFTDYLKEKAEYHKNRKEYLQTLLPNEISYSISERMKNAIEFEEVQAKLFEKPTEEVIAIEAQKLDMKAAIRTSFSSTDRLVDNNNLLSGATANLYTLHNIQKFKRNMQDLKKHPNSETMDKYLGHQIKDANYWLEKQKEKTGEAFHFLKENLEKNIPLLRDRKLDTTITDFGESPILSAKINSKLAHQDTVKMGNYCGYNMLKGIGDNIKYKNNDLFKIRHPKIRNLEKSRTEINKAFTMAVKSEDNNRYLDFFTSNVYGMFSANNYREQLNKMPTDELSSSEIKALKKEKKIAKIVANDFEHLMNKSYDAIVKTIKDVPDGTLPEYKGMNNFNIGLSEKDVDDAKDFEIYNAVKRYDLLDYNDDYKELPPQVGVGVLGHLYPKLFSLNNPSLTSMQKEKIANNIIQRRTTIYGKNDPGLIKDYFKMAEILEDQGGYTNKVNTRGCYDEALRIATVNTPSGNKSEVMAKCFEKIAKVSKKIGMSNDLKIAQQCTDEAIDIQANAEYRDQHEISRLFELLADVSDPKYKEAYLEAADEVKHYTDKGVSIMNRRADGIRNLPMINEDGVYEL